MFFTGLYHPGAVIDESKVVVLKPNVLVFRVIYLLNKTVFLDSN